MKFTIFVPIFLTIVQLKSLRSISDVTSRSDLHPTKIKTPNFIIKKSKVIHDFPLIGDIVHEVIRIPLAAYKKIIRKLKDFYKEQIKMFKHVNLLFDGNENLVKYELKLPNFNLPYLFRDFDKKIICKLFTKESGDKFDVLEINNVTALKSSHFDANRPTYILTHGFKTSSDSKAVTLVRDALLKSTNSNVITVNWSPLSTMLYSTARLFVPFVGRDIGKLINFLYENGLRPENTTLIGYSLGAHVMGLAGQAVNKKVNHTIGLDPAWPLFAFLPKSQRLTPDDALHVEIIHTNGGIFGYPFNTGHFDFYPNGGKLQKGCNGTNLFICSHGRSYKYLAEKIATPGRNFCAIKCKSYLDFKKKKCTNEFAIMGGVSFFPANQGQYYLETNEKEPFSLSTECPN